MYLTRLFVNGGKIISVSYDLVLLKLCHVEKVTASAISKGHSNKARKNLISICIILYVPNKVNVLVIFSSEQKFQVIKK